MGKNCLRCNDTGKSGFVDNCVACSGTGQVPMGDYLALCGSCGGSGRIEEKCPICHPDHIADATKKAQPTSAPLPSCFGEPLAAMDESAEFCEDCHHLEDCKQARAKSAAPLPELIEATLKGLGDGYPGAELTLRAHISDLTRRLAEAEACNANMAQLVREHATDFAAATRLREAAEARVRELGGHVYTLIRAVQSPRLTREQMEAVKEAHARLMAYACPADEDAGEGLESAFPEAFAGEVGRG